MRTRLLGGVAALIVAIIGTVLLITYVNAADSRALAGVQTEDVYVVQKAIPAGTPATSVGDYVSKKPMPKAAIPADPVTDLASLQGKVASVALQPGEQLLTSRFINPAAVTTPGRVAVPAGMQEVTLKLSADRVVGGDIAAGDTVGIIISFAKEDTLPAQTQMTFNKVLVTAVQLPSGALAQNSNSPSPQSSQGGSLGGGSSSSSSSGGDYLVTLARPASDVERIVHADLYGQIYLTKDPASATDSNSAPIDRTKVLR
ncbi:Flp pilus assembly protein CpaB [Sinomonas susongensis]|uniref:Flp pilus assembly protein CpaB n=1 Tax=Sinomonas susongensis TaxID=1324851 RepID=UPI001108D1A4|nr:RcpC/CpaB family pilus assembly protein [Sinomonas susongensis]